MLLEKKARLIIQDQYAELVSTVIEQLKTLPNLPNSSEIPFDNLWEAFANQMQHQNNARYYAYLTVIEKICQQHVQSLTLTELKLLWLISDNYLEWEDPEDFPETAQLLVAVAEELLSWVEQEAEEPQLIEEPDEDNEKESIPKVS